MIIRPVQYFLITLIFLFSGSIFAQHTEEKASSHEESFNAGEMIIEHIVDSYEWHILNYGDFSLESSSSRSCFSRWKSTYF
jgi:hypothetical protein